MKKLKTLYKKIKKKYIEFILNFKNIKIYSDNEPIIFVGLNPRTKTRTYLNLIIRLKQEYNNPIVLPLNFRTLFIMIKWVNAFENVYFKKPFKKSIIRYSFSNSNKTTHQISYNYKKISKNEVFVENTIQYIMHPSLYLNKQELGLNNKKLIGIVFSGNFDKNIYDNGLMEKYYSLENRYSILNKVMQNKNFVLDSGLNVKKNMHDKTYLNKILVMHHQKGAINIDEWLNFLSKTKFIICAPGMTMPMCHNIIEAMSVGTIPIVSYHNWMNPSLEDNINCLTFSDLNSLNSTIEKALHLSDAECDILSKNVINYYQKFYYSTNPFKTHKNLFMINEHIKDMIND